MKLHDICERLKRLLFLQTPVVYRDVLETVNVICYL